MPSISASKKGEDITFDDKKADLLTIEHNASGDGINTRNISARIASGNKNNYIKGSIYDQRRSPLEDLQDFNIGKDIIKKIDSNVNSPSFSKKDIVVAKLEKHEIDS